MIVTPIPGGTTEVLPGGLIRFTPMADLSGEARFSYVVADDIGTKSNVANVSVRVQNSQWQNPTRSLDVNNDGFISPIDALIVINYLNRGGDTFLPDSGVSTPPFIDPTGDENVTPLDALTIINFLNQGGIGEGEAELTTLEHVMMVTPEQMVASAGPQVVQEIQAALDETRLRAAFGESGLNSEILEPRLPNVRVQNQRLDDPFTEESDSDDEALLESLALSCTADEFTASAMEDAVDEFLREMGPFRDQ